MASRILSDRPHICDFRIPPRSISNPGTIRLLSFAAFEGLGFPILCMQCSFFFKALVKAGSSRRWANIPKTKTQGSTVVQIFGPGFRIQRPLLQVGLGARTRGSNKLCPTMAASRKPKSPNPKIDKPKLSKCNNSFPM